MIKTNIVYFHLKVDPLSEYTLLNIQRQEERKKGKEKKERKREKEVS